MRKLLILLVAAAAASAMVPANAKTIARKTVTMSALPCSIALCPYWVTPSNPSLIVTANLSDADSEKLLSYACTEPTAPGVYQDVVVTAPKGAKILVANYKPTIDWDGFICAKPSSGNNGKMLAHENFQAVDSCPASCAQFMSTKVKPGTKYVIRAYNFSDYDSLKLTYTFSG